MGKRRPAAAHSNRNPFYPTEPLILAIKNPSSISLQKTGKCRVTTSFRPSLAKRNLSKYLSPAVQSTPAPGISMTEYPDGYPSDKYSSAVTGGPCRSLTSGYLLPLISLRSVRRSEAMFSSPSNILSQPGLVRPEGFLCKMPEKAYSLLPCVCHISNAPFPTENGIFIMK